MGYVPLGHPPSITRRSICVLILSGEKIFPAFGWLTISLSPLGIGTCQLVRGGLFIWENSLIKWCNVTVYIFLVLLQMPTTYINKMNNFRRVVWAREFGWRSRLCTPKIWHLMLQNFFFYRLSRMSAVRCAQHVDRQHCWNTCLGINFIQSSESCSQWFI